MRYETVPTEITLSDIESKEASWSPSMYRHVTLPTSATKRVEELLEVDRPYDKGVEPGSVWYMRRSSYNFIRTKAIQEYSCLIYPKGDAIIPINGRVFEGSGLLDKDILMIKDSNVGECVIIIGHNWQNYMFSAGIVRLHPIINPYYLFSFLKHPLFKLQLLALIARDTTITHARDLWLNCYIPFPNQENSDLVIKYVSVLMEAIVQKEVAIRERNSSIDRAFELELGTNQQLDKTFFFSMPTIKEIQELGRLDTGMYSVDYKDKLFRIINYKYGYTNYVELGFDVIRGQNLQISNIGESIYSDVYKSDFYRLVAPTDISEYRTVRQFRYLGSSKKLSLLKQGDVIFGAEGFGKGRVVILADEAQNTISNIHGIIFHPQDENIIKGIFLGCFLGYLRAIGLVDAIAAGGSGGSLAISYFHHVPFPKFPEDKQREIAQLYHNPALPPTDTPTIDTFLDWHSLWNKELGIWELDREMKALQQTLADVQDRIIEGKRVDVPLN